MVLRNFPFKNLTYHLIIICLLFFSFKLIHTRIQTNNKNNLFITSMPEKNIPSNTPPNTKPSVKTIEIKTQKEDILLNKKEVLDIINRLNAYIEEQAFLLSRMDKNDPKFKNQVQIIKDKLAKIEVEAEKKDVQNLIDLPLIHELKTNINSYERTLKFSKN